MQALNEHLRNEDIDIDSERMMNIRPYNPNGVGSKIKEVDELSGDEDGAGFNSNNDSGIQKVLSRTKNSLQLHTLNKNDEEDDEDDDEIHHNDEIPL